MFNINWDSIHQSMLFLVKQSFEWGFPIESYVAQGTISAEEYKEITGEDYEGNEEGSKQPNN